MCWYSSIIYVCFTKHILQETKGGHKLGYSISQQNIVDYNIQPCVQNITTSDFKICPVEVKKEKRR